MTLVLKIMILVLAYVVWRIARRIFASYRHIDIDMMRAFWTQKLKHAKPSEHQRVIDHLGLCETCRQLLDQVRKEDLLIEQKLIERKF